MGSEVGQGQERAERKDAAQGAPASIAVQWREFWADTASPQLSLSYAQGLAGFFLPALLGGAVATVVFAFVAFQLNMWPAWLALVFGVGGLAYAVLACRDARAVVDAAAAVAVERRFALGAQLASAAVGSFVVITLTCPVPIAVQAIAVMVAMAVLGSANGTNLGRPRLVTLQALLLMVPSAVAVAWSWPGWVGAVAAGGLVAYAGCSIMLSARSHRVQVELLRAREERQAERALLKAAVHHMPNAVAILDDQLRAVTVNSRLLDLLGLDHHDAADPPGFGALLLKAPRLDFSTNDRGEFLRHSMVLAEARKPFDAVLQLTDRRMIDIEGQPVPDGGWVVVIRDTTGERAAMAELNREARRCPLTGLANRRAFMEELERRCTTVDSRNFALLLVDLDGFKQVNDRHGHPVGDRVITRVGYRLRTAMTGLFVARLGGDEFAVLADLADQPDVPALASKLGDVVQQPAQFGDAHVQLGAAIGVALAPRDGGDAGALLRAADLALLAAKAQAGSSIVVFEPALAEAAAVRLDEEARVQAALRSGAIDVAYQPLVDLATGRVIGIEALARWPGWANETLAVQRIVAIAEARGQIAVLRRLVLARALPVLSGLPGTVSLWLNISVADLGSPGFADELMAALTSGGIAPQRLVLEITETGLMTGEDGSAAVLAALRGRGVRIAMDDFGAGFSSLARLAQMPLDVIKISSALIAGGGQSELSSSIISAAARIGHSRGLKIVAEGIETATDLERVELAGIDCAQGYHLARPVLAPYLPAAIAEAQARMGRVSRKAARASELPPAA